MRYKNPKEVVAMHGPAFDGSGRIVNRNVMAHDIAAYKAAGYELGVIVEETPEADKPMPKVKGKAKNELAT